MASGIRLQIGYSGEGGNTTLNYEYADSNVSQETVLALCSGLITNGSIFSNVPLSIRSAKLVMVQEKSFDTSSLKSS